MEIKGTLHRILPAVTGTGTRGQWTKKDFVIKLEGMYPKLVCFTAWNDEVDRLDRFKEGAQIVVHFDIESREYNDKYFTNLKAFNIFPASGETYSPSQAEAPIQYSQPEAAPAYDPAVNGAPVDTGDLPF